MIITSLTAQKQQTEFDYRQKYYEAQEMIDDLNETLSGYQKIGNEQKTQRFIKATENNHRARFTIWKATAHLS